MDEKILNISNSKRQVADAILDKQPNAEMNFSKVLELMNLQDW